MTFLNANVRQIAIFFTKFFEKLDFLPAICYDIT